MRAGAAWRRVPGALLRSACAAALFAAACGAARAQQVPPAPNPLAEQPRTDERPALAGDRVSIRAGTTTEQDGVLRFADNVEIETGDARIHADEVIYDRAKGTVEARGNVVLTVPGAVLAGSRLLYRIEPQTGEIDDVVGYIEQDNAMLRAKRVERTGPERLRIHDGVFTTCTQPLPYWSFHLDRGDFHLGQYAYMRDVQFRAGRVPLFWSPYLVWPIKTGRARGLLFPEFRNSTKLGTSVGIPYYWPFAKNADLTLRVDAYTKVGVGVNAQLDWLPTWLGWAKGNLYFINDQVQDKNRYLLTWSQSQRFWNDFLLTGKVEQVSDFDYFTDYETNLIRAASPRTETEIDLSRSWSWYSLSFRAERDQLYLATTSPAGSALLGERIYTTLPFVEFRGRSQQVGKLPVFLSFRSSVAGFERRVLEPPADRLFAKEDELVTRFRSRWGRVDLAPQLQMPLVKSSWADLTLTAGWEGTWWSGRANPSELDDIRSEGMFRNLWNAGFTFLGPRFQRVYVTPGWSYTPKLKHVIEPFVDFRWRPSSGVSQVEIPQVDQVDAVPGKTSIVSYGLRQRFFVLRRPATGRASSLASARQTSFEGLEQQEKELQQVQEKARQEQDIAEKLEVEQAYNPVEIGSIELTQDYTFVGSLSRAYELDPATGLVSRDGSGQLLFTARPYSPVRLRVRFNPSSDQTFDAGYTYDVANDVITEQSISTLLRLSPQSYVSARWFRRNPVSRDRELGSLQSVIAGRFGVVSPNRRFSFETELNWDAADHTMLNQHYEARWATQCCSFRFGYDRRSFVGNFRREFSIVVDLFGIGEVLNVQKSK